MCMMCGKVFSYSSSSPCDCNKNGKPTVLQEPGYIRVPVYRSCSYLSCDTSLMLLRNCACLRESILRISPVKPKAAAPKAFILFTQFLFGMGAILGIKLVNAGLL